MTNNARVRRTLRTCRDEWPALRWRRTGPWGSVGAQYGALSVRVGVNLHGVPACVSVLGPCDVEPVYIATVFPGRARAKDLRTALRMVRRELVALDEAPAYVVSP
mgnify:CR=1 FL=1